MVYRFLGHSARAALAIATIAAFGAAANAQPVAPADAEADAAAESANEPIVVTGAIAEAQAASIREKRLAPNLVDVAAADAVGRFPD